ncbi:MAG: adenylate/guanylate cyclase domain-containing protein, partial [Chthoniobacterales bacterium]
MKRSAVATIWIGALSAILVVSLQKLGLLARPEAILDRLLFGEGISHNGINPGNYLLVVGLGFAVAWTMLQVAELHRRGLLLALLLGELLAAAWVISLGGTFFQPLPGIVVALLATALAALTDVTEGGQQRRALAALFRGRLADRGISRLTEGALPDLSAPQTREVTFVFCEIANQAELIDELPAIDCARLTNDFIRLASGLFLEQGGYLHGADGEGIRVVFGFPLAAPDHAAAAALAALMFRDRVAVLSFKEPESLGKIDLRIGVAAGPVVATVSATEEGRRDG